ncbi:MAG: DEAD/DEAH box helicase [Candidatus Melainabacteria bacterium]|nr:DEAD/DEAH box helicase [Candidatus Melainabacteria bacterium]
MREKAFKFNYSFKNRNNRSKNSRRQFFGKKKSFNDRDDIEISRYVRKAVERIGQEEYIPKNSFSELNISLLLKKNIAGRGYTKLTPIQDQAIPIILEGRDFLGIANTGTGKTASFLIPLIEKVIKDKNEKVLIMAPTRELVLQIVDELKAFSKSLNIYSATCIGGANIRNQIFTLQKKPDFVIGTPGRLKDLINRKCLNLSRFTNVVLDEVDRMLDMGFINDIKYFISLLPAKRQSLFFSATVSKEADNLTRGFLSDPVKISVKSGDTPDNVEQDIIRVKDKSKKIESLHDLLIKEEFKKVLVFGRTKRGVENLSNMLHERGFKVGSIHGNKSQTRREKVLNLFKTNQLQTLVATDVAARGLDIADITHVINYDLPATYDDYIHRIGRTGRANKAGKALTFVS